MVKNSWKRIASGLGLSLVLMGLTACGGASPESSSDGRIGEQVASDIVLMETVPLVEQYEGNYVNMSIRNAYRQTYTSYHFQTKGSDELKKYDESDVVFVEIPQNEEPSAMLFEVGANKSERWALRIPKGSVGVHVDFEHELPADYEEQVKDAAQNADVKPSPSE